jgi:hypothetical protein
MLPLPLMRRAVTINMQRTSTRLKRLDETDPAFRVTRDGIRAWASRCNLASDPEMSLRNTAADNWRVLLAIADDLGYGKAARDAAAHLCANRTDEDAGVVLLADIRTVFTARAVDRIHSAVLITELLALDSGWDEWRGPHDDQRACKLTKSELARLLRPFHIYPRTIWPVPRQPGDKSAKGYLRADFEKAWRSYCDDSAGTTSQASKIIELPRK